MLHLFTEAYPFWEEFFSGESFALKGGMLFVLMLAAISGFIPLGAT